MDISPNKVLNLMNITQISAGYYHSLGITNNNQVSSWGYNNVRRRFD